MRTLWGTVTLSLAIVLTGCGQATHVTTTPGAASTAPAVDPAAAEANALKLVKARPGTFVWRHGDSVSIAFTGWPKDEELEQLKYVRNLRKLDICCVEIPKDGLAEVAELASVCELHLSGPTADSDLIPLRAMKRLDSLSLSRAEITDHGLDTLATFPRLKSVRLCRCDQVTKVGVKHLLEKRIYVSVSD